MASERCVELLLSAPDYRVLDVDAQAARLALYLSEAWFGPTPIDTIDTIRLTQRVRIHASRLGMCVGDLMVELLQEARSIHESSRAAPAQYVQAPALEAENLAPAEASAPPQREDVPMDIATDPPGADPVPPAPAPSRPRSRSNRVK